MTSLKYQPSEIYYRKTGASVMHSLQSKSCTQKIKINEHQRVKSRTFSLRSVSKKKCNKWIASGEKK